MTEIILKIVLFGILTYLGGKLYRKGGTSDGTLWRDIGVSLLTLLVFIVCHMNFLSSLKEEWFYYLLAFGASWGALSAYWKQDEKRFGFWAHGLGLSLAILPLVFLTHNWIGFLLRTVILTLSISLWSEAVGDVDLEEGGRGILILFTIPLI
jgi:hypothetical protein